MKLFYIYLALAPLIYLTFAEVNTETPLCNTELHMDLVYFRNMDDPTKYWACVEFNKPAYPLSCPDETAFDDIKRKCIDWLDWEWNEPKDLKELKEKRAVLTYTEGSDGRPACQTSLELQQIYWRNNNDPTKYWKCEEKNQIAVETNCPEGYAFVAPIKICVTLDRWEWTPPVDPPSLA